MMSQVCRCCLKSADTTVVFFKDDIKSKRDAKETLIIKFKSIEETIFLI